MGRLIHSIHPVAATHAQTMSNDDSTVSCIRLVITLLTQLIKVGKQAFGPHLKHAYVWSMKDFVDVANYQYATPNHPIIAWQICSILRVLIVRLIDLRK